MNTIDHTIENQTSTRKASLLPKISLFVSLTGLMLVSAIACYSAFFIKKLAKVEYDVTSSVLAINRIDTQTQELVNRYNLYKGRKTNQTASTTPANRGGAGSPLPDSSQTLPPSLPDTNQDSTHSETELPVLPATSTPVADTSTRPKFSSIRPRPAFYVYPIHRSILPFIAEIGKDQYEVGQPFKQDTAIIHWRLSSDKVDWSAYGTKPLTSKEKARAEALVQRLKLTEWRIVSTTTSAEFTGDGDMIFVDMPAKKGEKIEKSEAIHLLTRYISELKNENQRLKATVDRQP